MSYARRYWTEQSLQQCDVCGYIVEEFTEHDCDDPR